MKISSISGTQGSGKTTLIRELIARLCAKGKRSAVIVNDSGEKDFDQDFIHAHDISVEYIRGG